ncbi:MAG: glycosyltransferase family 4 protein [Planctomycetota bacterium]
MRPTIQVLHVLDSTIHWDQRLALEQLLDRLPAERFAQHWMALGPPRGESARLAAPIQVIPRRLDVGFLAAPRLRRFLEQRDIEIVHAWGVHAMNAALTASRARTSIVASLSDPALADVYAKRFRAGRRGTAVAVMCASEIVRRRVIERGVPGDLAVLVRPGVDFATLNRVRKSDLRTRLGLGPEAVVLLTDQPATRDGGQFCAFWATAVRSFLEPNVRLVVPGCTPEVARLRRLAEAVEEAELLVLPGDPYRYEELVAVADVLLLPRVAESSVTAVAWAMAAGVPVIASATRTIAELLAHDHNAFLIKPDVTRRLALRFAEALGRRHAWGNLTEVARGQAYEVFSLGRCIEQVREVYENLLAGRAPADGLKDPAIVS